MKGLLLKYVFKNNINNYFIFCYNVILHPIDANDDVSLKACKSSCTVLMIKIGEQDEEEVFYRHAAERHYRLGLALAVVVVDRPPKVSTGHVFFY